MACRECVTGIINEGTPSGFQTTIHGLPTYVARPEGPAKGLIVIVPDAFSWKFSNSRVLADSYAEKGGFLVYIPEFMAGHGLSLEMLSVMPKVINSASWLETIFVKPFYVVRAIVMLVPFLFFTRRATVKPRITNFFRSLRTDPIPEERNLKIGVAGFCWGGQYAVLLAHDTPTSRLHRAGSEDEQIQPLIDCAYAAHPSFLSVPGDIEAVNIPLSIAVGDVDMALKLPLVEKTKEILEKKKAGDHEVVIYPGARHGFAIRGDRADQAQLELGEKARTQALSWFATWLS